jgi:predicted metal-dependent phosphotriesterase family hydrolase
MSDIVRTVAGDVAAGDLGIVNSHDHLFFATPRLPGQELDDERAAAAELRAFAAAGGGTVVQWTPRGLHRRLADLAPLAAATGVHLLAATGRHRRTFYDTPPEPDAASFIAEITDRRCGLIKIGTGFHALDAFERANLQAAAAAHLATGVPVAVHLERGTAGDRVAAVLIGEGVRPAAIVIGHLNRNPDPYYALDVAQTGVFLSLDGPSAANHPTDWRLLGLIDDLASAGHHGRLLLGGDTTTAAARSVNEGPGMPGLLVHTAGRIRRHLGDDLADAMLIANPARAWAVIDR